ncbi:unnamed protein product [Bursaphelenchus okinawaensis]|uniref:Calponin-homology (CH) domain-containing protein n=1 Tax=Bursaphelenchus okinawaensis TaxID=465554 RepID=A0A811LCB9_9BILA|nr:unnamed protein product [Bursaphelenchus okinawaensis]CAG9121314.1 unnamed protein product [Bursaphelenchus okinawaensis]
MAAGWRKFTGQSPYPSVAANKTESAFAYGVKQDRQYRLDWIQGRDAESEAKLLKFIADELGMDAPPVARVGRWLKDGVVLCKMLEKMAPGCLSRPLNTKRSEFAAIENIRNFLESAVRLGFEEGHMFEVSDLVDQKNIGKVLGVLQMLAEEIQTRVTVRIYY